MTTDASQPTSTESSVPAPQGATADQATAPAAAPETPSTPATESRGDAPRVGFGSHGIRIGSQRSPIAKFRAQPHSPGQRPRADRTTPASGSGTTSAVESEAGGSAAVESTAKSASDVAGSAAATELSTPAAPLLPPAGEASTIVVPPPPPPRRQAPLPSDLQNELDEALAGVSLDELINEKGGHKVTPELETESRYRATVSKLHQDNVFFDLGGRNTGVASLALFAKPPEVGAAYEVVIRKFVQEEGLYEVAVPGASAEVADWSDLSEGLLVDAMITGHNKGGLECLVNRIRGFIPASQVALYRTDDLEQFVGQKLACIVTEANEQKRNLVLSRRAMLEREAAETKQKLLAELAPGQIRDGTVRKLTAFGAFVDLGGIDGLIHVSQMSWDRVKHPSDVLAEGQQIKVKVDKIDPQTHKIGLSYRDMFESPWASAERKYPVTGVFKGTVSRIMDFGAFVKLEPGVEGLVHISELSHKRVFRTSDVVQEGQEVEVQILNVDPDNQRISLSMKALEAKPEPAKKEGQAEGDGPSAVDEPPPKKQAPKRTAPLLGGLGRTTEGDKFGLKW